MPRPFGLTKAHLAPKQAAQILPSCSDHARLAALRGWSSVEGHKCAVPSNAERQRRERQLNEAHHKLQPMMQGKGQGAPAHKGTPDLQLCS